MLVQVKTLPHFKGELPTYATPFSSGLDLRAQLSEELQLRPTERVLVPTGLCFAIPQDFEIQIRPRSGWALRSGITLLNTPGTIDADYRGEVKIIVINLGSEIVRIQDQDRIAQAVLCPIIQVQWDVRDELSTTERGSGGFGSTYK